MGATMPITSGLTPKMAAGIKKNVKILTKVEIL